MDKTVLIAHSKCLFCDSPDIEGHEFNGEAVFFHCNNCEAEVNIELYNKFVERLRRIAIKARAANLI